MPKPDFAFGPVAIGAAAVALVVAIAIAASFALLRSWHEPPGGLPSGAADLVPALRANGPSLQSAPQADRSSEPKR